MSSHSATIVRVYGDPGRREDEYRVLIDRLWPRGVRKDLLDYDDWLKDVAPSAALRTWYAHDVARFEEFARRYRAELAGGPASDVLAELRRQRQRRRVVLLTATKDVAHSGASVLLDALLDDRHGR